MTVRDTRATGKVLSLHDSRPGHAKVEALAARLDDVSLVGAIRRGDRAATAELFDRHAPRVRRTLLRVLGHDADLADHVQDVFTRALGEIDKLRDPDRLSSWLTSIAVFVARGTIRKRTRWRWLRFAPPEEIPEVAAAVADETVSEELRATYAVLEEMDADLRIAFALRFMDGMELKEAAVACDVSLATIKRRLKRAEEDFVFRAEKKPALAERLERGRRGRKA